MRAFSLIALCLSISLAAPAVVGSQDDPRLDPLFERLQETSSRAEADFLISRIWTIWLQYDGPVDGVEWMVSLGMVQMRSRDYEAAEKSFTEAIEADASFAEAWNKRATLRYMAGDLEGSILDIQQTLVREPRHFGALSGLGLIYMQLEEWEGAKAAFEGVLDLMPADPAARERIEMIDERLAEQNI